MDARPVARPLARPNEKSRNLCGLLWDFFQFRIFCTYILLEKGLQHPRQGWRSEALTSSASSPDCPAGASVCPCRHRQTHGLREGFSSGLLAFIVDC